MSQMIPNLLTLARLILAPVVAWCIWQGFILPFSAEFGPLTANETIEDLRAMQASGDHYRKGAAILFVIAALTDLFDGMAARALNAHSRFGRLLDPIADKALVGLPLLTLAYTSGISADGANAGAFHWGNIEWWIAIPVAIIVGRDLLITLLRMVASDGEGPKVSNLAKWKTTLELIAVAMPIFMALPFVGISSVLMMAWLAALWLAAALSLYTGLRYLLSPAS